MATYVQLINELLRRLNEVTLEVSGDGFDTVRNVQALSKDAINSSTRAILQDGQEWPFLKQTYTQTLTIGTRQYSFPADMASVDWGTFYLKKLTSANNQPRRLSPISYEEYISRFRQADDNANQTTGDSAPEHVYQTQESKFGVTPIPDKAYQIEYIYWSFPADLELYDDAAIIPDRFKHVIIDGAMMYMMRFRSNEQSAAIHQQNFQEGIKAMRRILLDDKISLRSTVLNRTSMNG